MRATESSLKTFKGKKKQSEMNNCVVSGTEKIEFTINMCCVMTDV